ncbi:hypothetical protein ACFXAZ_36365 [Streptomyces sp. NPDC059477]|uniref:hypothetical protein n=1 Tax=Streptomyces sp. NPDC059477 TaxID=3346847 RepID=UPI0036CD7BD4
MPFKMTEEFASAMVTVIPIIMLVAAVEFNSFHRTLEDAHNEVLHSMSEKIQAAREGREVPAGRHRTRRTYWTVWAWLALWASHTGAEVQLIRWLAGDARQPDPLTAQVVANIAILGFAAILLVPLIQQVLDTRSRRLRFEAMVMELESLRSRSGTR